MWGHAADVCYPAAVGEHQLSPHPGFYRLARLGALPPTSATTCEFLPWSQEGTFWSTSGESVTLELSWASSPNSFISPAVTRSIPLCTVGGREGSWGPRSTGGLHTPKSAPRPTILSAPCGRPVLENSFQPPGRLCLVPDNDDMAGGAERACLELTLHSVLPLFRESTFSDVGWQQLWAAGLHRL